MFLYEAFNSGAFRRLVVAEVVPEVVTAVRREDGFFCVNIAHRDRVESVRIGPIEIHDPALEADRQGILAAIVEAEEIATAVPSVAFYVSDKPGSIHRLLAEGLCRKVERGGPRLVVYAAENHNHAAEILEAAVMGLIPQERARRRPRAGALSQHRHRKDEPGRWRPARGPGAQPDADHARLPRAPSWSKPSTAS